jgi:transcriptional regulator of acetoin/glycerol metabolism
LKPAARFAWKVEDNMDQSLTVPEEIVHMVNQLAQGRIQPLRVARRAVVKWALAKADGNVSQAAQMLKISRGTIYRYARS